MSMRDFVNTLNEEQKKALLEALSSQDSISSQFVPEEVNQETKRHLNSDLSSGREVSDDFIVNTKKDSKIMRRKERVKAKVNTWQDTGEAKDVITPEINRTPRNRPSPKKVTKECTSCGKAFDVDTRYVYGEYYRCDRCGSRSN